MVDYGITRPNPAFQQQDIPTAPVYPQREMLVQMTAVSKRYEGPAGTISILSDINLAVGAGEFIAVTGPSGSGKSTLINMITGIDHPTKGEVLIKGSAIHRLSEDQQSRFRGRMIGVVFQFFQLLPTLSALENVMMPMTLCGTWKRRERQRRARHLLKIVGMDAHAHKFPAMLSGGQQQRVAIARALANDPPLLVGDEPTGNLDRESAQIVFELFKTLVQQGKTVIIVTHDISLAERIPRLIEVQDGRIQERWSSLAFQRRSSAGGQMR